MSDEPSRWLDSEIPDELRAALRSASGDGARPAQLARVRAGLENALGSAAFSARDWSGDAAAASGGADAHAANLFGGTSNLTPIAWTVGAVIALGLAALSARVLMPLGARSGEKTSVAKQLVAHAPDEEQKQLEAAALASAGASVRAADGVVPLVAAAPVELPARRHAGADRTKPGVALREHGAASIEGGELGRGELGVSAQRGRGGASAQPGAAAQRSELSAAAQLSAAAELSPAAQRAQRVALAQRGQLSARRAPAPGPDAPTLAEELASLDRIRSKMGTPARALSLASSHAKRFANGALVPERELLQLEGLLRAGQAANAKQLAGHMLTPSYPYRTQAQRLLTDYGVTTH